jgi:tetratricopeptide (TPR) repeat protein
LDRTGAYARLEPAETLARYQSLRQNHRDLFQPNPASRVEWHERMAVAAEQGKFWPSVIWHTDAALRLKPALVDSSGADQLFNRRGYARAELGDYAGASSDFQKAVQIDPDDVFNWWNLVTSYLGTGETIKYEAAVLRAIEHFTTRRELGFTMGIRDWALANLAAFAPSRALREKPLEIIRRTPGLVRGQFQSVHGIALIRAGRLDEGISLIQTAIAQARDTTEKHEVFPYLAIAHAQQGLFDEARKDLEIAEKDMLRLDSKLETRPEILDRTVYLALRKEALALLPPQGGSAN